MLTNMHRNEAVRVDSSDGSGGPVAAVAEDKSTVCYNLYYYTVDFFL